MGKSMLTKEQIPALYAKGVSVREIQDHLNRLYGVDVLPTLIPNVTKGIMPVIKEWQSAHCKIQLHPPPLN